MQSLSMWQSRAASRWPEHARRARPPAAAEATKSPPSLVNEEPASARDHGSGHTVECKHADELPTMQQAAKLAQPRFATKPAKGSNHTPTAI
jgi:hypothetical protein